MDMPQTRANGNRIFSGEETKASVAIRLQGGIGSKLIK
jgi:hypothetical protein